MVEIGQALISPRALYEMIHNGPGTFSMDRAHDAAKAHSTTQQEINDEILAIAGELQQAWRGQAAEGAHGATQPLRDGATMSSAALDSAQQVHASQGQQFSTTHREMDPLEGGPPQTNAWDSLSPWDTDTEQALRDYNSKASRNVELYESYGKATDSSVTSMPNKYGVFPRFDGEFSVATQSSPSAPAGEATSAASYAGPSGGGGGTVGGPSGAQPGQHAVSAPTPGPAGQPGQPVHGPGSVTGTGAPAPQSPTGAPTPGTSSPVGAPRPGVAPGIAPLPGGAANTGDAVRAPRGTAGRFNSGSAPGSGRAARVGPGGANYSESGSTGRGAPTAGRVSGGPAGPGGRLGAVPGAAAAAEAATARGTAGPTGRPGVTGAPMAPGARSNGAEDEEHQRKTLLEEPDAEGVFGTDERTPPPVIGEAH